MPRYPPLRRQVGANHRMLATYLNTFRRHGLWLDRSMSPNQSRNGSRKGPVLTVCPSIWRPGA